MATMLSEHFSLEELTTTQVRDVDNTPDSDQLLNLSTKLAPKLEEVRALIGPMHVNSGYRSQEVNRRVNGSPTSQHTQGLACDFIPLHMTLKEAYLAILRSNIAWDQAIAEFFSNGGGQGSSGWIHVSTCDGTKPMRKQALIINKQKTGGKYLPFSESLIP
jgi:hypothetical protein